MVQRLTSGDCRCYVSFEMKSWGQGRVPAGWQRYDPLLPNRSSVPNRARARLQSLNTEKGRSTDWTHHSPDMVKLNVEGKKLLLIEKQDAFWGRTKLSYLFESALNKGTAGKKKAGFRTRASYSKVASFSAGVLECWQMSNMRRRRRQRRTENLWWAHTCYF